MGVDRCLGDVVSEMLLTIEDSEEPHEEAHVYLVTLFPQFAHMFSELKEVARIRPFQRNMWCSWKEMSWICHSKTICFSLLLLAVLNPVYISIGPLDHPPQVAAFCASLKSSRSTTQTPSTRSYMRTVLVPQ